MGLPFIVALLSWTWEQPLGVIFGYALGYIVDPDLDIVGLTKAEGTMLKKLGILAWPWLAWWLGYALIIRSLGGHRS